MGICSRDSRQVEACQSTGLKILHCIPTLGSGGAERQLALLSTALIARKHEVHVAYLHGGPNLAVLVASGSRMHVLRARSNHDPAILFRLRSLLRSIRPDLVQTWLPQMDVFGGIAAQITHTPWILSERSSAEAYGSRIKDRVLRPLIGKSADAIVANSDAGAAVWLRAGHPPSSVLVVRNALPSDTISRATPFPREELGIPAESRILLFAGRLAPEKKLDILLKVAEQVVSRRDVVVLVCGDGPLRSQLEVEAARFASSRIRFLGYRTDLWRLMKTADALISTSEFEGNPNTVLEAMACGCPLVVSDIPAHREFLDESLAAIVPERSVDAYVSAVREALSGTPLTKARATAAEARSRAYRPAAAVVAYEQIYSLVANRAFSGSRG